MENRFACLLLCGSLCAVPGFAGVHGCAAKDGSRGRIVKDKSLCNLQAEVYTEWTVNSGLPHEVDVPATGTPDENGSALFTVLNLAQDIQTYPQYLVQLDAGYYAVPQGIPVSGNVHLRGAGMVSTFIEGGTGIDLYAETVFTTACKTGCPILPSDPMPDNPVTISDLTIIAPSAQGETFASFPGGLLLMDHVQLIGPGSVIALASPTSRYIISNSIIGNLGLQLQPSFQTNATASVSTITASEIDIGYGLAAQPPAVVLCLGAYNSQGQLYTANCLPQH